MDRYKIAEEIAWKAPTMSLEQIGNLAKLNGFELEIRNTNENLSLEPFYSRELIIVIVDKSNKIIAGKIG